MKRIEQKHDHGCAVACLAMVLNRTYEAIDRNFLTDFGRKGIRIGRIADYLIDNGLSVIEKKSRGALNLKKHNQRMLEPFAQAHIVMFQPCADSADNHMVVMTKTGKILDPSPLNLQDVSRYYYAICVLGIFWD